MFSLKDPKIFEKRLIFIPLHVMQHWIIVVITKHAHCNSLNIHCQRLLTFKKKLYFVLTPCMPVTTQLLIGYGKRLLYYLIITLGWRYYLCMEAAERKVNVPDQSEWKFYDGKVIFNTNINNYFVILCV